MIARNIAKHEPDNDDHDDDDDDDDDNKSSWQFTAEFICYRSVGINGLVYFGIRCSSSAKIMQCETHEMNFFFIKN